LVTLANILCSKGYQILILTTTTGTNRAYQLNEEIKYSRYWFGNLRDKHQKNILLKIINKLLGSFFLQNFLMGKGVGNAKILLSFSPDITVNCSKTKFRKKLIAFEHLPFSFFDQYPKAKKEVIAAYPKLKKVVVLTDYEKDIYKKMGCDVIKIPNTYPFFTETTSTLTVKKVVSVGHLNQIKRRDLLLDAWKDVAKKHPDWELIIVGDGELKNEIQNKISTLGLQNSVTLVQQSNNIVAYYMNASVFVLSSELESFSLVLLEAKVCGLPCVSFNVIAGPGELINDKQDGFLVDFPDTKTMAEKINVLIENPELRNKFGQAGRIDAINRFSPEKIASLWEDLLIQN
jgi:glycosyltransferase involved in cell wall biosynthesis